MSQNYSVGYSKGFILILRQLNLIENELAIWRNGIYVGSKPLNEIIISYYERPMALYQVHEWT